MPRVEPFTRASGAITVEFQGIRRAPKLASRLVTLLELVAAGESKPVNQLNVIISGDETLKQLNSDYGGFAEATDVLSFDLSDESVSIEGDIYISMDRAVAQAAPRGEHPSVEVCRLAVHGLLHLCGWDHEDDVSLASMMDRGEKYLLEVGQEP